MTDKKLYEPDIKESDVKQAEEELQTFMQTDAWPAILQYVDSYAEKISIHSRDDKNGQHDAIYLTGHGFAKERLRPVENMREVIDGSMMDALHIADPADNPPRHPSNLISWLRWLYSRATIDTTEEVAKKSAGNATLQYEYINPNNYICLSDSAYPQESERSYREAVAKGKEDPADINRLFAQLQSEPQTVDIGTIMQIAMDSHLLVARNGNGRIQGMATLCVSKTLHGTSGLIEDVVVDKSLRGNGVGEELMKRLIQRAQKLCLTRLELTSHPTRVAANKLYQKLGFQLRETNCYTLTL